MGYSRIILNLFLVEFRNMIFVFDIMLELSTVQSVSLSVYL